MHTILLVDDEEIICNSMKAKIERIPGLDVEEILTAYNALDALKIAEKVNPDVIITDIKMPGMNGIELIKEMINNDLRGEYIILSGYDDYVYVREAFKCGIVDYLLKPASTEDIKEKLYLAFERVEEKTKKITQNPYRWPMHQEFENNTPREKSIIDIALKYIEDNIENVALTAVSNMVCMNYTYFSEFFKKQTGITFSDYVMNVKMRKAKALLQDPLNQIQDVAYEIGYENPKNFTRAFKKYYGISPTDFRKNNIVNH